MSDDTLFDIEPSGDRRCKTCGEVRPLAMFYVAAEERHSAKLGTKVRRPCRVCVQRINERSRAPRAAILNRIKAERGCVDCGLMMPDHPEVFDFDHLPGVEKSASLSSFLTGGSIDDLMAEVAKCEVVCANCHRIRTRSRQASSFGKDRGAEHRPWSRKKRPT